ncbi:MAG: YciI family protein [Rhizobiaceae bacterium]|nr:YciI family protein [Rhizobiaceae bacterium]MCV0405458.1 YciI family protein [Rhizobiaceae bacterium]
MRHVCLVYHTPEAFARYTSAQLKKLTEDSLAYDRELEAKGHLVVAHALGGVSSAKSLRVREGRATVVDGPFAETKEQLVGFILVEASDEAEALRLAEGIPLARTGTIEVRAAD